MFDFYRNRPSFLTVHRYAPNADQQHFNNCIQDKSLLQIDRHLNKSTESRIENERDRQEYDDVDQITPPPRSATSFGCLNVAFCHSLEIIVFSAEPED